MTMAGVAAATAAVRQSRAARSRSGRPRSRTFLTRRCATRSTAGSRLSLVYTPPVTYARQGRRGHRADPGPRRGAARGLRGRQDLNFTMRKGLKFSDGSPLKASDFEDTIKRVLTQESGGTGSSRSSWAPRSTSTPASPTATSRASRPTTRRARSRSSSSTPDGTFIYELAMNFAGVVPRDTPFKNLTKDPPPGVGPYMFTKSVRNREFMMVKNTNFDIPGIPKGNIDTITTKIVKRRAADPGRDQRHARLHDRPPAGGPHPGDQVPVQGPLPRARDQLRSTSS